MFPCVTVRCFTQAPHPLPAPALCPAQAGAAANHRCHHAGGGTGDGGVPWAVRGPQTLRTTGAQGHAGGCHRHRAADEGGCCCRCRDSYRRLCKWVGVYVRIRACGWVWGGEKAPSLGLSLVHMMCVCPRCCPVRFFCIQVTFCVAPVLPRCLTHAFMCVCVCGAWCHCAFMADPG